jgi:hypothetical protein
MLPMLRNRLAPALADQSLLPQWSDLRREIDRLFESTVSGGFLGPPGFRPWTSRRPAK